MAYDFSTLIPSASPYASAGLDPQEALASDDPYGMLAAAQAGVPYQAAPAVNRPSTRPVPPDHPGRSIITLNAAPSPIGAVQSTGVSSPPDGGAVRSVNSPGYALPRPQDSQPIQPANNAPNPTSEKPSGPQAVPASVQPGGGQSKFSDVARQMLAKKSQALDQAQAVPNAPDVGSLEQQRTAAAAAAPNPNDPNYKPSLKSRFLRGIEGVGLGLAEGGLRGAIAGGIAPQTTGLAGYRDPNSAFSRAKATNDQTVGSLDQQLKAAQDQQKQADEQISAKTGIANSLGTGAEQATQAQNAETEAAKPPKVPEGEMPLGQTGPQLQKALQDRYQVLNPGKSLPAEFQLPANATQKDYDRIDKAMENVEKAHGTVAQQGTVNAMREQAMAMRQAAELNAGAGREFQAQERGRGLLDKAEGQYRQAQQGANMMRDMLAGADAGNKMSAQMLPLEGALQITTAQGVHRINRTEVEQYSGAGNLYDRVAGELGKLRTGVAIPKNVRDDIRQLVSAQEKGAYQTYKGAFDSASKRYGLKDEQPLPQPGSGSSASSSAPNPQTHIFDSSAYAAKHPNADMNAVKTEAKRQGFEVR
jgi:hypothetical protein